MANNFLGHKVEDWMPQEPWQGPPLPEFLNIYWPWYKPPGAEFVVSDLVISPPEVNPGQVVTITCTVTNIRVENLNISPTEVQVGEKVTISVTATNYGTVAGSKTITCTIT